ncbi:hypothetical protein JCM6882_003381 [Rhodosporidiobolus microsporus]
MPAPAAPEHIYLVNPQAVTVMGRNSQVVAAALMQMHLPILQRNLRKQRHDLLLSLNALGDVGIALLRLKAQLPPREDIPAQQGGWHHINLEEELHEVGIPTQFMNLEFAVGNARTPEHMVPRIMHELISLVEQSLRALDYYPRSLPQGRVPYLPVPRTTGAPEGERGPPGRAVAALNWSQPLVPHHIRMEVRPSASAGVPIRLDVEVPAVGSHHQQAIRLEGFGASAQLVIVIQKFSRTLRQVAALPHDAPPTVHQTYWGYVATQAYFLLLLVETEEQAIFRARVLYHRHGLVSNIPPNQQPMLNVWEEECSLDDAPTFAFDVLVHGAPDEQHLDMLAFNSFRSWVLTFLTPTIDRPDVEDHWQKSPARRLAKSTVNWLAMFWPSLQAAEEVAAGAGPGPRRAVVLGRMEKAFGRVFTLFNTITAEELLERRREGESSSSSSSSE